MSKLLYHITDEDMLITSLGLTKSYCPNPKIIDGFLGGDFYCKTKNDIYKKGFFFVIN